MTDLNLKFSVNALCAAEALLNKNAGEIFAELQSEEGASLTTLRALVAAGQAWRSPFAQMPIADFLQSADVPAAGRAIEEAGVPVAAEQVGKVLGEFLAKLSEDRSAA